MRILLAGASVAALAWLGGCGLQREIAVKDCTDFYEHTRERQVNAEGLRAACTCAVEREAAGQTPVASVPPRPNPALPSFRRHLPDCLQANGGSASGVAARESSGAAPRLPVFDPATGRVTEPPGQVMPGPGEGGDGRGGGGGDTERAIQNANRAIEDMERDFENAMRDVGRR